MDHFICIFLFVATYYCIGLCVAVYSCPDTVEDVDRYMLYVAAYWPFIVWLIVMDFIKAGAALLNDMRGQK